MFQRSGPFTPLVLLIFILRHLSALKENKRKFHFHVFVVVSIRPAWALLVIEALSGNHNLIGFNDNGFFFFFLLNGEAYGTTIM